MTLIELVVLEKALKQRMSSAKLKYVHIYAKKLREVKNKIKQAA